jgi:chromate reductase, NAD(P)H dehydrogenase (quinone)
MTHELHILGIAGSLRTASVNAGLLRAAATVLPAGMTLEVFDLSPIPLYNGDLDGPNAPESVRHFKERIAAADALLVATPEYNYSVPGVLKNAIDWASRPPKETPLNGKPLAMMGAGGIMGTVRAQMALRQIAVFNNMFPLNKPEVLVTRSWEKFDAEGNLKDEATLPQIRALLEALAHWTRRLKTPVAA